MSHLTIVAKIKARAGSEEELRQKLLSLIEPTLQDEGCIEYKLHRSLEDPTLFPSMKRGRINPYGKSI